MTKRKNRKGRGGRRPKQGVPRTPSGQISRSTKTNADFGPTLEALAQRAALVEAETGHALEGRVLCSEDAGWYVGRLYMTGQLGDLKDEGETAKARRTAAECYWRRAIAYESLLLAPKRPTAAGGPRGRGTANTEETYVKAKAEYDTAFEALTTAGRRYALAVARAIREEPPVLDHLIIALDILDGAEDAVRKAGRAALDRYRMMQRQPSAA